MQTTTAGALAFKAELTKQYEALQRKNDPAYVVAFASNTPEQLAEKMTVGLILGTASKDGKGIRKACAALKVRYTYKSIFSFLRG